MLLACSQNHTDTHTQVIFTVQMAVLLTMICIAKGSRRVDGVKFNHTQQGDALKQDNEPDC